VGRLGRPTVAVPQLRAVEDDLPVVDGGETVELGEARGDGRDDGTQRLHGRHRDPVDVRRQPRRAQPDQEPGLGPTGRRRDDDRAGTETGGRRARGEFQSREDLPDRPDDPGPADGHEERPASGGPEFRHDALDDGGPLVAVVGRGLVDGRPQ
jgi:hypothetical protein